MSKTKSIAEQMLVKEITRAWGYLGDGTIDPEKQKQLLEVPGFRLIQEAQMLREAVMLRQQREIAEHVRNTIRADMAAKRARTGLMPS